MAINYASLLKDIKVHVRDILRADNTLISTILDIAGGTANANNYVFANRPVDQRKGFVNPRIVLDDVLHAPLIYGDNPDCNIQVDELSIQIAAWVDDNPWSTATDAVDRIRILLNKQDFSLSSGGAGTFKVSEGTAERDPDKENTIQGRVILKIDNLIATE